MVAFLEMHVLAVRISEVIDPCPFIETDSVHNKSISVPFSNRSVAEPLRIGILREFRAIGPDFSQHASPLEELQESIFRLDDLKGSAEEQNTRITERIALAGGIVSQSGRTGSRAVRWLMGAELLVPAGGYCRRRLHATAAVSARTA